MGHKLRSNVPIPELNLSLTVVISGMASLAHIETSTIRFDKVQISHTFVRTLPPWGRTVQTAVKFIEHRKASILLIVVFIVEPNSLRVPHPTICLLVRGVYDLARYCKKQKQASTIWKHQQSWHEGGGGDQVRGRRRCGEGNYKQAFKLQPKAV